MKATVRLSSQFRQPLIKFLGKRKLPSAPDVPNPHPQAPPEFQKTLGHQSTNASGSSVAASKDDSAPRVAVYSQFWEAPSKYRVHGLEKVEIDSIMSGGASTA
ncbi:hypothetical protein H1R20_g5306, partial [Candolleomyces eurysporus]